MVLVLRRSLLETSIKLSYHLNPRILQKLCFICVCVTNYVSLVRHNNLIFLKS